MEEFNADIFERDSIKAIDTHNTFLNNANNTKKCSNVVIPSLDLNSVNTGHTNYDKNNNVTTPNNNSTRDSKRGRPPLHPKSGHKAYNDLNALQSLDSLENLLESDNFNDSNK